MHKLEYYQPQSLGLLVTRRRKRSAQLNDGFTLLELLTVIVCVGILVAVILIVGR